MKERKEKRGGGEETPNGFNTHMKYTMVSIFIFGYMANIRPGSPNLNMSEPIKTEFNIIWTV